MNWKQVSGFIIKQHLDMVQKVNYYDILLKVLFGT